MTIHGFRPTTEAAKKHCASRLVAYSCPSEIRVIEKLPMTAAQKLDRIDLRNIAGQAARNLFTSTPNEPRALADMMDTHHSV